MRRPCLTSVRAARLLAAASVVATMAFAPPPADTAGDKLRTDAATLASRTSEPLAKAFLEATRDLPAIAPRTLWRSADRSKAITDSAYQALPEAERSQFTKRDCDATFYWNTGYGSPLAYLRPIEIAASHGLKDVRGKRIADFGFGTIGHLRLLASLGADVHGMDVEPLFKALYAEPGDTGTIKGRDGVEGSVSIHLGRWPGDATIATEVGGGYDLLLSKNTLKRGYIHPAREVDPKFLVHLGVDDATFLKSVRDALKPGGLFLLYNICPAQNPTDKPYLPHADGQCPWDRATLEAAGFEVLAFDVNDIDALLPIWKLLGYDDGADEAKLRAELFVWYTVARRRP